MINDCYQITYLDNVVNVMSTVLLWGSPDDPNREVSFTDLDLSLSTYKIELQ